MKRTGNILILLLITIIATSCDGGDRDRIPAAAVRVEFANQAMWDQYGVSGSFIHRRFILNQKIPAFQLAVNSSRISLPPIFGHRIRRAHAYY